ncbi:15-hydroxyprostaglandin dehydrogenase [NAD(+)]-like isoform X2 [Vespa crabro]|uniref:15-hydroxyprostaglandin dehydrogenase [NAD(+)]-like isoform X2 n=2 Tax=Vespa crabro TaxID=7445 RepID=UPI001F01E151|nr:15-hydroxyprostaglandin dehydrogenase [NAD(+)]-like isoform X2 [Vespa crabro]
MLFDLYKYHSNRAFDLSLLLCDRYVLSSFFIRFLSIYLFRKSKMEMMARRMIRRRSSASERAKELEEINGVVSGKNILITGGAAGLGYAFVNSFLKHGANKIAILDIDGETCKRIGLGIEKSYGVNKVYFIQSDVAKHEQSIEAFEEASILMTEIDIVINNAGILDERRWEREIAVNITGMISTAMLAVKHMSKESGGHGGILVNVSEHMNIGNTAQLPVYAATKHAIIGLSQSLADPDHYERTGIRVITLCPGLTETGLTIDSPNKLLSRVMKADFVKNLEQIPIQTPYIVAQGLLNVLRFGESGSIWVIESGRQPYEIYVPNPCTLRRRYKNNMTYDETKIGKGRKITKVYDNGFTPFQLQDGCSAATE